MLENAEGQATGVVFSVEPTKMSEGPHRVYRLLYTFSPAEDSLQTITRAAYSLDGEAHGKQVLVKYVIDQPAISVPEGMTLNPGGPTLFLAFIVPLLGLGIIRGSAFVRWKKFRFFEKAPIAPARVVEAQPTRFINGRRHYAITFEFEDERKRKVEVSMGSIFHRDLHAEEVEYLIYPPEKPQKAELISY